MEDLPSRNTEKTSRLEQVLTKIKIQLDYTMNLTERTKETQNGIER